METVPDPLRRRETKNKQPFCTWTAAPIIHFMYFFLCCWFFGLVDAPLNASVDVRVVGLIGCLVGLMTVFTRHLVISVPSEHVRSV